MASVQISHVQYLIIMAGSRERNKMDAGSNQFRGFEQHKTELELKDVESTPQATHKIIAYIEILGMAATSLAR